MHQRSIARYLTTFITMAVLLGGLFGLGAVRVPDVFSQVPTASRHGVPFIEERPIVAFTHKQICSLLGQNQINAGVTGQDGGDSFFYKGISYWTFGDTPLDTNNDRAWDTWRTNGVAQTADFNASDCIALTTGVGSDGFAKEVLPRLTTLNEMAVWPSPAMIDVSTNTIAVFYDSRRNCTQAEISSGACIFNSIWQGVGLAYFNTLTLDGKRVKPTGTVVQDPLTECNPVTNCLLFTESDRNVLGEDFTLTYIVPKDQTEVYLFLTNGVKTRIAKATRTLLWDKTSYRYWNGVSWVSDITESKVIWEQPLGLDGNPVTHNGFMVSYNTYLDKWVAVYSTGSMDRMAARTADSLLGPWSSEEVLVDCSNFPQGGFNFLCYTGRVHPEHEKNGGQTLYLSYANSGTYRLYLEELVLGTPIYQWEDVSGNTLYRQKNTAAPAGFSKNGIAFYASAYPGNEVQPIYEWYNPNTSPPQYLYSHNTDLASFGFVNQGVQFYASVAPTEGLSPIHQWNKPGTSTRVYSAYNMGIAAGYTDAGIAFYAKITVFPTAPQAGYLDVTNEAVQTVHRSGVPHFGRDGVVRTAYDPVQSFFANGLWGVSDEPKDQGALAALDSAGFNTVLITSVGDPNFYINQKQGLNTYVVVVSTENNVLDVKTVATTTNNIVSLTDPDLVPGTRYTFLVCASNCGTGTLVTTGTVVASGTGMVDISWENGSDVSLLIDNKILASDGVFHASGFNEARFNAFRTNPNILGWLMVDEPWNVTAYTDTDPAANYQEIAALISSHIGTTSQALVVTEAGYNPADPIASWWSQFVDLSEIASVYLYPKIAFSPFTTLNGTAQQVGYMLAARSSNKPAWFIPQAFTGWPIMLYMTPEEARAQAYTAIIHGATGLIHFTWDSCFARGNSSISVAGIRPNIQASYPDCAPGAKILSSSQQTEAQNLWNAFDAAKSGINKELRDLEPVLLSPTSQKNYSVFVNQKPNAWSPIRTILKEYGGYHYLFAVNVDNALVEAQIILPERPRGMTALFEPLRAVPVSGQSILDHFDPFDVHVYRFSPDQGEVSGGSVVADVAITSINTAPQPIAGDVVSVSASVANVGAKDAVFSINLFDETTGVSIATSSQIVLLPGDNASSTVSWNILGAVYGSHMLRIEAVVPGDINPANNSQTISIVLPFSFRILDPDVDNNGYVTVQDILAIARAFGSTNFFYDQDANGAITIQDVFYAARNFGLSWPPNNLPEGKQFMVWVQANHPSAIYSVSTILPDGSRVRLPGGACFDRIKWDGTTGTCGIKQFLWTPASNQSGTYVVEFGATYGAEATTQTLPIGVLNTL